MLNRHVYLRGLAVQGELLFDDGESVFLYSASNNEEREREAQELLNSEVVSSIYTHILKILANGKFEVVKSRRFEPGVVLDSLMNLTT
jgi:hypothetical protein